MDELDADGVTLLSSVDGQYLGHRDYWPLMEELDRRCAVVFVHPNLHASVKDIQLELPGYMIEFVFDTTRAVANLITSGTMERYPNIRFILSHAGGTVPYIAWRLSLCDLVLDKENNFPKGTLHYIKQFYYDTALSPSPNMLASAREVVGMDRLLFGSDFPFAPTPLVHAEVSDLGNLENSGEGRDAGHCETDATLPGFLAIDIARPSAVLIARSPGDCFMDQECQWRNDQE